MAVQLNALLEQTGQADDGFWLWDSMAVEVETAGLLFSLVRQAKPRLVVESGTGRGVAARFICEALLANGHGALVTFEQDEVFRDIAADTLEGLPATIRPGMSRDSGLAPDMVFVDCYGPIREPEITFWLTQHELNPLVVVHDACRPYPFHLGEGVFIPGHDGVWIGRPKETH